MQNAINYVGVDISKLSFDVAIPNGAKYDHHKFDSATRSATTRVLENS